MNIIHTITITVLIPDDLLPESYEAWMDGNWDGKLGFLRTHIQIAAQAHAPAGTTITMD